MSRPFTPNRFAQIIVYPLALIGVFALFNFSTEKGETEADYAKKIDSNYNIYSLSTPSDISFAGETVPLDDFDVRERLDRELHVNTYFHSQTILYFKRANRWFPIIEPILEEHGIPADFKYLALVESGFQNVISPVGATGFWQFMKTTGKEYGLEINGEIDERYHVEKSTAAACQYLKDSYEKFGSWSLVAASYNVGKGRITSELKRQKAESYYDLLLNEETKRYVFRILAVKQIFEKPENYGFNIRETDLYPELATYTVTVDSTVNSFADFAKEHEISYKILKYFNPWLRDGYLKNPSKKSYEIKLPKKS